MKRKHNRFGKGGCFTCLDCGKKTRDTGYNGDLQLCPLCLAMAEGGNTLSDSTDIIDPWSMLKEKCNTVEEVEKLTQKLLDEYKENSGRSMD